MPLCGGARSGTRASSGVGERSGVAGTGPLHAARNANDAGHASFIGREYHSRPPMISFTNVTKQYGPQILFVDASFQVNAGEKVGLVGPNGSGKTTVFRLIAGEESPDDGAIDRQRRMSIGYFRQDAGDVSGRTVLAETIPLAAAVAAPREELAELE